MLHGGSLYRVDTVCKNKGKFRKFLIKGGFNGVEMFANPRQNIKNNNSDESLFL